MVLHLKDTEQQDLRARITVFGVGGAGGNAVNNMIEKQLAGVEFIAANTDAQALDQSRASRKLQLGINVTQGLGAGSKPEVGYAAAEETIDEIVENLQGSHMCFITAGMGGGTGTGAAPVVARAAREMGILTVGVVTKPFQFEGSRRMQLAEEGVAAMQEVVDTLIVIPNQNLFQIASERTTFVEAFIMADDVLYQGVQGVTDLMVRPGMINLDFADVRSVMEEMGKAMMGTGEAEGDNRAQDAAEKAIANPLLDEVSLKGARGVLINITGGYDLTLFEMDEAANRIKAEVDPNALIKFGSAIDPDMEGKMRVSVVATGIDIEAGRRPVPEAAPRRRVEETDPDMIAAARGTPRKTFQVKRAPAPAPAAEAAEPEAPAAERREETPAAEDRAPERSAARAEAAGETRAAAAPIARPAPARLSPKPEEIRARAEEVRQRALEARERRRMTEPQRPDPEEMDPRFELDDASLDIDDGAYADQPEADPGRSFIDRQRAAAARPPARAAEREPEREPEREASSRPAAIRAQLRREAPEAEPESEHRSGLFAINRLINRVSGSHAPSGQSAPARTSRDARAEPRFSASEEPPAEPGDDDPEGDIPAFLRRQAN